ncbi:J domain-containing protein [Prochlorococcus marinus]|uniref:J domain-containing protein n=1 Tax=Prochlorococcus marinus XMU1408 TaxID=2213228 RepID=A0A318R7N7_PROMR|nr:J domain-containing protein [Prochlorococcus marinus]MBW3041184.1 J domain-containing protein [Prochlorococcus marinus str. XMU1408]PYE03781.1 J domain-containing protein [Prochlorococcus marinus XMU1408]
MTSDPYQILKVHPKTNLQDIKKAYRELVKIHHPDKGGDIKVMLEINAAWEILKTKHKNNKVNKIDNCNANRETRYKKETTHSSQSEDIKTWFKNIYIPIDKLLGQIVNPLPAKIRDLSADPYDELLMDTFCLYLEKSKSKINKVKIIYTSIASPSLIKDFSLDLYHCLSQVEDGLNELERYTMGYVDNYLHDGKSMIAEAKKKRKFLQTNKKEWLFNK